MKISIKPKVQPTDQYNVRLPVSLKQRLESLKTQASEHDADFTGTLIGVLEEFATELETRFASHKQTRRTNPNKLLGQPEPTSYGNGTTHEPEKQS
jgi:hypothetical protein